MSASTIKTLDNLYQYAADPEATSRFEHVLLTTPNLKPGSLDAMMGGYLLSPNNIANAGRIFKLLTNHHVGRDFFKRNPEFEIGHIACLPTLNHSDDTLLASAHLMAAKLRSLIQANQDGAPDVRAEKIIKDGKNYLHVHFNAASFKSALKDTQHALVDMVARAKNRSDLSDPPVFLSALSDLDGAEFWTQKIKEITAKKVTSLKQGDILRHHIIYEPK